MQPSDDVIERLRSLQEAVALEARLQEFVHGLMVKESHTNVCYRTMTQTLPFGRSVSATILALGALITCCGSLMSSLYDECCHVACRLA